MRRDLPLVAKRVHKFPRKYTQVYSKSSQSLANYGLMGVTQLAFTLFGWPNGEKLALTCVQILDLDQSERKSTQVNASQRKCTQNGVASRPKFSTCVYLRLRLSRALECSASKGSQRELYCAEKCAGGNLLF